MTPPRDTNSDRELGRQIGELAGNIAGLTREAERDRELRDEQHKQNRGDQDRANDKLDQLLGISPMVTTHETWIRTRGEPTVIAVADFASQVKGASKLSKVGYSLGGGIGALGLYVAVKVVPYLHAILP